MKKNVNAVFKTPFSMRYWKIASMEASVLRNLVLISLFIAMAIVLEGIGTYFEFFGRKVYLSFLPISLAGMLFGPVVGLASGAIIDILGFFVFPSGYPFYFGYTLSAVLGAFTYAIFLYRSEVTLSRIFLAKFSVNLFINVGLGSLWMLNLGIGTGTYWGNVVLGLIKNGILLPIEVLLMVVLLRAMIPISKQFGLISEDIPDHIKLFQSKQK